MTATMHRGAVASPRAWRALLRHRAVVPVAIGLLGFTISMIGIVIPSIWYDEAATIISATRSWPQLWAEIHTVDAVHALYYSLMHVVFDVVGYSPLTLRMPSAIAMGFAAALVVVLGRQVQRERLAWIAGLVFCVIPRVTWMGTEGRSYAVTAALAVLLTVVLVRALRGGSRRWWVLYTALAVLSCVLFLYLALVVVAHGITVVALLAMRKPDARRNAIRWAVAAATAALVALPFAREVIAQSGQVAWIHAIGPDTVRQVLRTQWFYGTGFAIVAWLLIVIGVASMIRRDRRLLAVIVPALVLPTVALIVISELTSPIYQPRYITMCTPFVALAIAAGIDAFRWRLVPVVALVALAALALPQITYQRTPESKENASWEQVAQLVAHERQLDPPGTRAAIIYGTVQRHPGATARVIAYSYPAAFEGTIDVTLRTPAAETGRLWETHAPLAASTDRLEGADVAYLITSKARDLRPETTAVMRANGWHVVDEWDFTSVHVLKYERD